MRFTLAQLETLMWVVRLGSFRSAAARLNVTQPAISVRIRELEAAAGGNLFLRDSYRARPTPLGRELALRAERVMAACEEVEGNISSRHAFRGAIRIGVVDTFAMTCLSALMRRIEDNFPEVRAEIRVDFSALLDASLLAGDLDIAVLTAPTPHPQVSVEPLLGLDLQWVASPKLALGNGPFTPQDFANLPIITNPSPAGLYASITGWFATAGVQPARLNTCNSMVIMRQLAREAAGISLLPTAILRREIQARALRVLPIRPKIAPHQMAVAYRRDAPGQGLRMLTQIIVELTQASDLARYKPTG